MRIGVLQEPARGERRVALVPESVARLVKAGHELLVEEDAGAAAGFSAVAYEKAGARTVASRSEVLRDAELVVCVRSLLDADDALMREGTVAIGLLRPMNAP